MSSYNSYSSEYDALFGGLLLTFIIVGIVLGILGYIITAIIFYNAAKTNGLAEIAFWSWIPIANAYVLFALGSIKTSTDEIKKDALKFLLIYIALAIISIIPFIGILASIALMVISIYYIYRLFYRWIGDTGKSILFVFLTFITCSIFYYVYGLLRMKKPFVA
ncbi:hypothetical protein U5N28_10005 [Lysinibacillus telephonicus]|uniref:Uncharacterized protein n=1 Tax=Lysinibacillus telephonicus TaxID=1714840 RepID=A0A3S0KJH1_9BACI|nr:hypothetical protein [Lysinibacillus telephonicus]RTQ93179.1 hypothetical protein EKG35_09615 [Lysinibacillus telephonicus]